ncbi:MAG: AAA family ATPase [Patescibacteria group bacterium]
MTGLRFVGYYLLLMFLGINIIMATVVFKANVFGGLIYQLVKNKKIMKKIVIGLTGEAGSGKDTVGKYLEEEYGATQVRFADPIKETLSIYFDKLSREDQSWLFGVFQERFGADILSRAIRKRIEEDSNEMIVVNGLRMPPDYDFIRSFENSYVLYVTADQKTRWQRSTGRGEKSDDGASFEDFKESEKKETEVHIPEIGAKSDYKIENNEDLETLLQKVDDFLQEIGFCKK